MSERIDESLGLYCKGESGHGCDSEWQGIEGQLSGEEDDEIVDVWTR